MKKLFFLSLGIFFVVLCINTAFDKAHASVKSQAEKRLHTIEAN